VLTSRRDPVTLDRVDVLLSTKAPTGPVTAVHLVTFSWRSVLCLINGEGLLLPRAEVGPAGPDAATSALAAGLLGAAEEGGKLPPTGPPSPGGAVYGGAAQVGYSIRPGATVAGCAEVVLRYWVPWSVPLRRRRDGIGWRGGRCCRATSRRSCGRR
jgi:hypothetical protein